MTGTYPQASSRDENLAQEPEQTEKKCDHRKDEERSDDEACIEVQEGAEKEHGDDHTDEQRRYRAERDG